MPLFLPAKSSPPTAIVYILVIGSGTSIGAIAGALTIARLRVGGLVIALLFGGVILTGVAYNLLATTGV